MKNLAVLIFAIGGALTFTGLRGIGMFKLFGEPASIDRRLGSVLWRIGLPVFIVGVVVMFAAFL